MMSQSIQGDVRGSVCVGTTALQHSADRDAGDWPSHNAHRRLKADPMCELHNGIPVIHGIRSGYYHFDHSGNRRLILTRKEQDSLSINGAVDLVVLEVNHDQITLGIVCPDDTVVHGNEINVPS